MFNLCVSVGVFPQYLKIAEVIPIFKKVDKNKTTNYRPISLLSQLDKLIEKMIYSRISAFLGKYNLLSETQFGFRKNFSLIHAVSRIYENLLENVDHDRYSCCLFLDLSKAFDTEDNEILFHKLERLFGMRGTVLSLMRSYLTNRYQYTKILNTMSSYESISCGIPQGSCLGPLLFRMYINDLLQASFYRTRLLVPESAGISLGLPVHILGIIPVSGYSI